MRRRTFLVLATALAGIVFTTFPAGAITNGTPDTGTPPRYPNVGEITGLLPDGTLDEFICSGQLISPTVMLTAGHCTSHFASATGETILVTFQQPLDQGLFAAKKAVTDPKFDPITFSNDDGVVILKKAINNVPLVQLPTAGLLDQMQAAGTLRSQEFMTVGYGCAASGGSVGVGGRPFCGPGNPGGGREFATESFLGLSKQYISFQLNTTATGQGAFCFSDDGGPHLLGTSFATVGATRFAVDTCQGQGTAQRLDIPSVRSFLGQFVTLP